MKHFWLLIGVAITMVLTGCAKVPDCGDEKTLKLTKELIFESLFGAEAKNLSDMFKVEISAVQTVSHSKDPERYSCKANIKIGSAGKMSELFGNSLDKLVLTYLEPLSLNDRYMVVRAGENSAVNTLYEPKVLEFVSTTGQQGGETVHIVEIQKLWARPDALLTQMVKFAKAYTPPVAATKPIEPAPVVEPTPVVTPNEAKQETTQNTTLPIAPSFDCAKATSNAEKLICSNAELATSDEELSRAYKLALSSHPDQADAIRTEQINWRKNIRDQCADANCMLDAYRNRNSELSK
jgi:uncharacterized protein YecT (DUF1311 family)